jgi:hypothetical protein
MPDGWSILKLSLDERPHDIRVEFVSFLAPLVLESINCVCVAIYGPHSRHCRFDVAVGVKPIFPPVHGEQRSGRGKTTNVGHVSKFDLGSGDKTTVAMKNEARRTGKGRERATGDSYSDPLVQGSCIYGQHASARVTKHHEFAIVDAR